MRRRTYLHTAALATIGGLAGCLGGDSTPEAANEFGYETDPTEGVDVPLVPLADAIEWYQDESAAFIDARSRTAFEQARIAGAMLSPAPDGQESDDPTADLSEDARIVTYCGCPHHLSTLRGSSLIRNEYSHTYALDEGFQAWIDAGHPVEGEEVQSLPAEYRIQGRTEPAYAGNLIWAWHDPSEQREAAPIADDGTFALNIHFYGVSPDSHIRLESPAGEMTRPLGELASQDIEL